MASRAKNTAAEELVLLNYLKISQHNLQDIVASIEHALKCAHPGCNSPSCYRMKKIWQHIKQCKKQRDTKSCALCKQFINLCCFHTQHCKKNGCLMPFCENTRRKWDDKKLEALTNSLSDLGVKNIASAETGNFGAEQFIDEEIPVVEIKTTPSSASRTFAPSSVPKVYKEGPELKRCHDLLKLACHCQDYACTSTTCQKMKNIMMHARVCFERQKMTCFVCKQLFSLCYHHATTCSLEACDVLFCYELRQRFSKFTRQQLIQMLMELEIDQSASVKVNEQQKY